MRAFGQISMSTIEDGKKGDPAINVILGNESQNIPCNDKGIVESSFLITIPFAGYNGTERIECIASVGILPLGVTLSGNEKCTPKKDGKITLNVAKGATFGNGNILTGDVVITFQLLNQKIIKNFTWTKTKSGEKGDTGNPSRLYILEPSTLVIKKGRDNILSPNSIIFNAYYRDGNKTTRNQYSGRFIIKESVDGKVFVNKYNSSKDESTYTYVPSSSEVKSIQCELYFAGGVTNKLDTQTIIVLTDLDNIDPELTEIKSSISSVSSKVDANAKKIEDKVWQTDITTSIDNYNKNTVKTISDTVVQHTQDLQGIHDTVSNVESTLTEKADGSTVRALSEKISNAEQNINGFKQTVSETYATKDSLNNYSTTEQMNSAISQTAGNIKSEVQKTYSTKDETKQAVDGIEIGGRNFILDSGTQRSGNSAYLIHKYSLSEPFRINETYILTIYGQTENSNNEYSGFGVWRNNGANLINSSIPKIKEGVYQCSFVAEDLGTNDPSISIYNYPSATAVSSVIDCIKLEIGNKSTAWTPAPEDVDEKFKDYSTTEQMNSSIEQTAGNITSQVNKTLEGYSTTTQMNSAINQRAEAIESTVSTNTNDVASLKQTATDLTSKIKTNTGDISTLKQTATELTSTISSYSGDISNLKQTAKELTSTVQSHTGSITSLTQTADTLSSTINDPKTGLKSQIKQNADNIKLSATKTELNNIKIGGRNLILNDYLTEKGTTRSFNVSTWAGVLIESQNLATILEPNTEYTLKTNAQLIERTTVPDLFEYKVGFLFYSESSSVANREIVINNLKILNQTEVIEKTFTTPEIIPEDYELLVYTNRFTTNQNAPFGYDTVNFSNFKLEKGNKATDYTIAPEDIDSQINQITSSNVDLITKYNGLYASVLTTEEILKKNAETINGVNSSINTLTEKVETQVSAKAIKLSIQQELEDGITNVKTTTGFTFDKNGLNVTKNNSEMSTKITEDGMIVSKSDKEMLTANNQGVNAVNLRATTYLIIGDNSRFEDFGVNRTGCFWIGK